MAHTKPASSRAIAVVTTLAGLPLRASLRYRAHNRSCAFQAISRMARGWLSLLPQQQLAADPGREAVGPGRFDQQPAGGTIAGLGDPAASDAGAARMLARH